jgi:hypothetical protein
MMMLLTQQELSIIKIALHAALDMYAASAAAADRDNSPTSAQYWRKQSVKTREILDRVVSTIEE